MKQISTLLVCLMLSLLPYAQKKETKDYGKLKAEVDEKVFGTPDPAFKDNVIPDQYKNESAIILAQKYTLESDSKFKFRFMKMSGTNYNFYDIYRKKILINDRAALDEYSQLNFTKLQARSRGIIGYKNYTFINIRLIKPNGTIKNIDVDESAITLKDEKSEKQNKIAIPDLAIGDIIDYYVCSYIEDQYAVGERSMSFVLSDDYPTVNFVINLQFDARISVEYQAINGAPDFKVSPDQQGGGNVLYMTLKNVPKIKGLVWSSAERQLPIIRLNYAREYIYRGDLPPIKTGTVGKSNSSYPKIMEDAMANSIFVRGYSKAELKDFNSEVRDAWQAYTAKFPKANNPDSIPSFVFRYLKWKDIYADVSLEKNYAASYFPQSLKSQLIRICDFMFILKGEFEQDLDLVVVTSKNGYARENLFDVSDLSVLARTRGKKAQFFSFADNLDDANRLPQEFEGEKAVAYPLDFGKSIRSFTPRLDKMKASTITLPSSEYSANVEAETTSVRMDGSDPQLLHFKRNVRSTGHLKKNNQANLAIFQDIESQAGSSIGKTKDMITRNSEQGKSAKKGEEELKTLLEKAKTTQKESFENEIKQVCDVKPKEIKSFGIKNVGLEANAPFEYEEEFVIEGWVKKAGNNYIVDIGKFIVTQIAIDKDQRERTKDIYMPFARNFTYHIEFTAPDGYTIEGLDKLNSSTENKTGAFISSAKMEGNKLIVDINKYYMHAFEPAANWPLILSFLDKALEFNQQKILLKKK